MGVPDLAFRFCQFAVNDAGKLVTNCLFCSRMFTVICLYIWIHRCYACKKNIYGAIQSDQPEK